MIEWDTVYISAALSGFIGLLVALYVRFFVKPPHEKLFEGNRNENLHILFNQLRFYDSYVQSLFEILTREFGELTSDRKKVVLPSLVAIQYDAEGNPKNEGITPEESVKRAKLEKHFESMKEDLKEMIKSMEKIHSQFERDYTIYHNYIHASFLQDVQNYYWSSNNYFLGIIDNQVHGFSLRNRHAYAKKMIEYLKVNRTIKRTDSINEFVDKWTET